MNNYTFADLINDDDEEMAIAFWTQMVQLSLFTDLSSNKHGGSMPGKRANIPRNYADAHKRYMLKYFWPSNVFRPGTNEKGPEQPEAVFERRFRMPRLIFSRITNAVVSHSEYFRRGLKPDATGKTGITPLLKIICALRQISYDIPADLSDDLFDVSETTAALCLENYCIALQKSLGPLYIRDPTPSELIRIEREFEKAGFPGCIGCLDCSSWTWKNCPKALQGLHKGKDGSPSIRMEAICSLDLWIWSLQFGLPGTMNDLNILEISDHFCKVLNGCFPPITPNYTIDGRDFNWFYYLTDGIYPDWKIFMKSITEPTDKKSKLYAKVQESIRKCVERLFGVLYRRFKILYVGSEFWTVEKMKHVVSAAVIIHNMVVESRRGTYRSDGTAGYSALSSNLDNDTNININFTQARPNEVVLFEGSVENISDDIKVRGLHRALKAALINHQWNLFGASSR